MSPRVKPSEPGPTGGQLEAAKKKFLGRCDACGTFYLSRVTETSGNPHCPRCDENTRSYGCFFDPDGNGQYLINDFNLGRIVELLNRPATCPLQRRRGMTDGYAPNPNFQKLLSGLGGTREEGG